jgi:addiction module HigA family antidote
MAPLELSANRLALELRVPATRISDILDERRAISPDTALRLAQYFRTTPEFWLNLQTRYDLDKTEDAILKQIRRDVHPLKVGIAPMRARSRAKK